MNTPADVAAETATYPRDSKNDGKPDRRAIPRRVSDRFGESRTEITISGQLFPKSDGNSQFPDRFGKSCPAIGKVGRNSKKLSSILKSRTETLNSRRKSKFPGDFRNFRTAFSISV